MQFPRDMAQRRLLRGNQLLRQIAALFRQHSKLREQLPVRIDHIQAGEQDRQQRRAQKHIHLPLHAIINLADLQVGLLLALVVLHQKPRHRRAQRRLPRLQREPDLRARFVRLPISR